MLKRGGQGAIVNMSSVDGLIGNPGAATYCATKHGVIALRKTETPTADRAFADPEFNKFALSLHPLGRFGQPKEISEDVAWMLSARASFRTGHSLVLGGGFLSGPNPLD